MKLKTHHIALKVHDLKRCEDFYAGVLGLPVLKYQRDRNENIRAVWLDLDGTILMLERSDAPGEREAAEKNPQEVSPAGWHLLALDISSGARAAWLEKLQRQGIEITGESRYSIYFRDPENNNLALSHYPEPDAEQKASR